MTETQTYDTGRETPTALGGALENAGFRAPGAALAGLVAEVLADAGDSPYRDHYLAWRAAIHARGPEWRAVKPPPKPAADGLALNKHGDLLARFKTGARLVCDFWAAWRDAEASS